MSAFFEKALQLAQQAYGMDEVPVGAIIVKDNQVIASAHNRVEETSDPSAHAEILAIRTAAEALQSPRLIDCDLYVTLEPCPMCAQAISFARIRRLYFGAYDPKGGGVEHGPRIFNQPTCHHAPEVIAGVMEQTCSTQLKRFFKTKRNQQAQ